jgi:hypothetical protein
MRVRSLIFPVYVRGRYWTGETNNQDAGKEHLDSTEFFNLLNHTNLGTPNQFVNTSSFGSITEAALPCHQI